MIVAAASVPNPPLLLPGMTGGPVAEVEQLRAACLAAISVLLAADPEFLVVVGGTQPTWRDRATFGGPTPPNVAQSEARGLAELVGRSLLAGGAADAAAGAGVEVRPVPVPSDAAPADCWALGQRITEQGGRLGLLVMADGSACRSVKAPGYLDERAAVVDDGVVSALRGSDWNALARLDAELCATLLIAGRVAWQTMAGALSAGEAAFVAADHYVDDPFGVLYPVFSFVPAASRT